MWKGIVIGIVIGGAVVGGVCGYYLVNSEARGAELSRQLADGQRELAENQRRRQEIIGSSRSALVKLRELIEVDWPGE